MYEWDEYEIESDTITFMNHEFLTWIKESLFKTLVWIRWMLNLKRLKLVYNCLL